MVQKKPIPETTRVTEEYWTRLSNGELTVQHCNDCGHLTFPPRLYCVECYSENWEYSPVEGIGDIYGYSIIHRPSSREYEIPVVSGIVELEEGPRIMGRIDCDPAVIEVGMRVELDPSNLSGDDVRVTFKPVE